MCWSELPEKIWLRVFQNLSVKDVNNLHLVCRNLHQLANLYVNPILRFNSCFSEKSFDSLTESSRLFQELEFLFQFDHLLCPENIQVHEKYISLAGIHIRRLMISSLTVDPSTLQNLLNLLPNLESLELDGVWMTSEQSIEWNLTPNPTKIEQVKVTSCAPEIEALLESLENCAIKELELEHWANGEPSSSLQKFMKAQQKTLKKLTIACDFDLLDDLKDLRLEHLVFHRSVSRQISLGFFRHQVELKFLRLEVRDFSDENFQMIWELRSLETLELSGELREADRSNLNQLHRLEKLKRLKIVHINVCENILDYMKFGVFQDLEELDAIFVDASVDSVQEMKRIAPNLKKIQIHFAPSDTIDALLETLKNLESVKIVGGTWKKSEKVYLKIEALHIESVQEIIVEQFATKFPNLVDLTIQFCRIDLTISAFVTLLSELKQLRKLRLDYVRSGLEVDRESVLQCFRDHGTKLEEYFINVSFSIESAKDVPVMKIRKDKAVV
jgi:DNA-binding Lrp family transcriptional regulator